MLLHPAGSILLLLFLLLLILFLLLLLLLILLLFAISPCRAATTSSANPTAPRGAAYNVSLEFDPSDQSGPRLAPFLLETTLPNPLVVHRKE